MAPVEQDGRTFLGNLADAEPGRKDYAAERPEVVEHFMKLRQEWLAEVAPGPEAD